MINWMREGAASKNVKSIDKDGSRDDSSVSNRPHQNGSTRVANNRSGGVNHC
jgi:hypothetical protein